MRPGALLLSVVALGPSAALADYMTVLTDCRWIGGCTSFQAIWLATSQHWAINADQGCRDPGQNGMYELCMDWPLDRAHFKFQGQGKRCLRKIVDVGIGSCGDGDCSIQRWEEVPCTW
ncbi:hypothetical protein QBC34DRAFT_488800 [Podospora aff. communis PSN243]|uniref:Secreted protein n=1 Tax=Podospora aff. communis PSN243 TaxID=3040156 RepID=A0AAV9G0T0_9PEZI|nr:hypothetical protein QBC34DRAFT_488800 [Podospora aff. communis PSN243]